MYLLDTNACIDFLNGRSAALAQRMAENFGSLWVSSISVAELMVGSRQSADSRRDAERINVFVANLDIADFDEACARRYGAVIRAIGVQALERGLVLVTRNGRDFDDVPGLVIEDWTR